MSLDCIRIANESALSSPCVAELITTTAITVVIRTFDKRAGVGIYHDEEVAVLDHYPVRELKAREVASSGGLYQSGDIKIEQITKPITTGGGWTEAQIKPALEFDAKTQDKRVLYLATGDIKGAFALVDLKSDDIASWSMVLRRTRER